MYILVDEQIRLEKTDEKHAPALFEVVDNNRSHLSEFLPWVPYIKTVNDLVVYARNCELLFQQGREVSFMIFLNDRLVGRIGLHQINPQNKQAAIGYWVSKEAQGKGIITKCCTTILNFGFNNLQLHRIEIKAAIHNVRSRAIPEKLGFVKEGVQREAELVNEVYFDLIIYSMLRHEWLDKTQVETAH